MVFIQDKKRRPFDKNCIESNAHFFFLLLRQFFLSSQLSRIDFSGCGASAFGSSVRVCVSSQLPSRLMPLIKCQLTKDSSKTSLRCSASKFKVAQRGGRHQHSAPHPPPLRLAVSPPTPPRHQPDYWVAGSDTRIPVMPDGRGEGTNKVAQLCCQQQRMLVHFKLCRAVWQPRQPKGKGQLAWVLGARLEPFQSRSFTSLHCLQTVIKQKLPQR